MFKLFTLLFVVQIAYGRGFEIHPKIIKGIRSEPKNFPFYVNLASSNLDCGGSLISDTWIITAAHCLGISNLIDVNLGIRENGTFTKTVQITASEQYQYPGYLQNNKTYDIGLIKLPQRVQLSEFIQPAKLPRNCEDIREFESVITAGNGQTHVNEPIFDVILRQAIFKTLSRKNCQEFLALPNTASIICANTTEKREIGFGDSGGPAIQQSSGVLVGVIKGTVYRHKQNPVELFTKITHFFNWISHKTGLSLPKCKEQAAILS